MPLPYSDSYGRGDGPRATPAIADDKVFTFGADSMLHCLRFANGKTLRSVDTKEEIQAAERVFRRSNFSVGGRTPGATERRRKDRAGIVAFDKTDGRVIWKATDDQASYSSPVAASINGKRYAFFAKL